MCHQSSFLLKKYNLFCRVFFILFFPVILSAQTNYFVGPNGIDETTNNRGKSPDSPFATVQFASKNLEPGSTLYILGGTYQNENFGSGDIWNSENTVRINELHGTPTQYITIKPYNNQKVIFKGDGANIFRLTNSSYLRIEGLEIYGEVDNISLETALANQFLYRDENGVEHYRVQPGTSPEVVETMTFEKLNNIKRPSYTDTRGFYASDCHHLDIVNNIVHHAPGTGLRVSKSDYVNVIGNEVHNCSRKSYSGTHALVFHSSKSFDTSNDTKIVIARNSIHDNYNEIYSWAPTKTIITPHIDEGKGISMQTNEPKDGWTNGRIRIENNIAYGNGFSGIHVNNGSKMDIINNTVYNNNRTGSGNNTGISLQRTDDIKIINNIAVSINDFGGKAIAFSNSSNVTIDNNMVLGKVDADVASIDNGSTIFEDPLFNNPTNKDFTLRANSPAINKAKSDLAPSNDYTGNERDSQPDLGAYESGSVAPPPTTNQTTWYVSTSGNDNSGIGTITNPYATITKAAKSAQPGHFVYVRGGTYRNNDFGDGDIWEGSNTVKITANGAPNQYITFQPYQNEKVLIEFDDTYGVLIANSSYLRFQGFEVKGIGDQITRTEAGAAWGLYKDDSGTIKDLAADLGINILDESLIDQQLDKTPTPSIKKPNYYNGRGIVANNSHHIDILDNTVRNAPASAIRAHRSDYVNIIGNTVYNNTFWTSLGVGAITVSEATNIDNQDIPKIILEKNIVYNNENRLISWAPSKSFVKFVIDEGTGLFLTRNRDTYTHGYIQIANNLSYQNGASGIICHVTNRAIIENNTVYKNGTTNHGFPGGIGLNNANDVIIRNNIAYARPTKWAIGWLSGEGENIEVTNNLVFNENGTEAIHRKMPDGWIEANPSFTDAAKFDFSLSPSSPAINRGTASTSQTTDINGDVRNNGLPDIGAFEFQGTVVLEPIQMELNESICIGESYVLNNQAYNQSGTYQATFTATNGADSIVTLELSVINNEIREIEQVICSGESYVFDAQTLTQVGFYSRNLTNANGCPQVETLLLDVLPSEQTNIEQTICQGDSFVFDNKVLNQSGTYSRSFVGDNGCINTETLTLAILEIVVANRTENICAGESFIFNGQALSQAGTYRDTLVGANGCDHYEILTLIVLENGTSSQEQTICAGESIVFNNQTLTQAGTYLDTISSANGCQNIINYTLNVLPKSETIIDTTICEGNYIDINGETISISGTYEFSFPSSNGCDSIILLNFSLENCQTVSTQHPILETIKIYPNPVQDQLVINALNVPIQLIQIINSQGQIMQRESYGVLGNQSPIKLQLNDLTYGIYWILIQTEYGLKQEKIAKIY